MIMPMIILFILGALQGAIGWLMVKSGLVPEKYFVGHVELTTHFIAALFLLGYTYWFALKLLLNSKEKLFNTGLKRTIRFIFIVLFFQLIYGGFMAGLHAAASAPTWPDINGQFIPATINELSPWAKNLVDNLLAIHFIHRGLAYLLFILVLVFYFRSSHFKENRFFTKMRSAILILIMLQVLLGIFTVLHATNTHAFVWLGVFHQFTAMLLVICMVGLTFIVRGNRPS